MSSASVRAYFMLLGGVVSAPAFVPPPSPHMQFATGYVLPFARSIGLQFEVGVFESVRPPLQGDLDFPVGPYTAPGNLAVHLQFTAST